MKNEIKLTKREQSVYEFCIKMGDNHELAMKAVEIERAKADNTEFYRVAYES